MVKQIKQKISFSNLLKGKFLIDNSAPQNWKFLIFILFLGFLMILSSHSLNAKVSKLTKLKEDNDELYTHFAQIHSRLMKIQLESELVIEVYKDSLKSLEKHPFKIIVNKKHGN